MREEREVEREGGEGERERPVLGRRGPTTEGSSSPAHARAVQATGPPLSHLLPGPDEGDFASINGGTKLNEKWDF